MTIRQVIEDGAERGRRIVHLSDVVDPDIPLIPGPVECVGETSSRLMALQHQNPLAGVTGEQRRRGQTADAAANHDGVECIIDRCLVVARDSHGAFSFKC